MIEHGETVHPESGIRNVHQHFIKEPVDRRTKRRDSFESGAIVTRAGNRAHSAEIRVELALRSVFEQFLVESLAQTSLSKIRLFQNVLDSLEACRQRFEI